MRLILFIFTVFLVGCHLQSVNDSLFLIQIQDRNGLTETISNPDRLEAYQNTNFLEAQPYRKVFRVFKHEGKNSSKITTYHPNGMIRQYLEIKEMRACGAYREWYENGQQKIEAIVINGTADLSGGVQDDWLFDSQSRVWDEKGNLKALISYQGGFLEGASFYYHPNGMIKQEINFHKNAFHGMVFQYFENSNLKSKTEYIKGIKEGQSLGFFEDGQKAWLEDFSDGRLLKGIYYDLNGNQISEVHLGDGFQARFLDKTLILTEFRLGLPEGLVKEFDKDKTLQKQFFVKQGKKNGEELYFYPPEKDSSAQPRLSVTWKENLVHGTVKTWYNNGQLESERKYSRNTQTGPSFAWYRDGSLMIYEEYEEGLLMKGQYHQMGNQSPISTIRHGAGVATLYDDNGLFLRKITYFEGKPVEPEN